VALLKKYRDFCNNTFRSEITAAQNAIAAAASPLQTSLNFLDLQRQLNELIDVVPHLTATQRELLQAVLSSGEALTVAMSKREAALWADKEEATKQGKSLLTELWEQSTKVLKELTSKKDERDKILKQKEVQLADIDSRLKLAQILLDLERFVENAKWADKGKIHQKKFTALQEGVQRIV
jgi:hypothetical protein